MSHPFTVIKGNPVTLKRPPATEFHVAVVLPDAQIMNSAQQYKPDMLIVFPQGTKAEKPSYALAAFCPCGHPECNSITVMQISADGGGFRSEKAAQEFLDMLVKIIQSGKTAEQRLVDHLPIPQGPINPRDVN